MKKSLFTTSLLFLLLAAGAAHADNRQSPWDYQVQNIVAQSDAPMFNTYYGAASLYRTRFGIEGRVMAQVDNAGEAYTVWIVIFNKPFHCATSPCSADDLGNERVEAAVLNGTGAISASDGNGGGVINADFSAMGGRVPDGLCCFGSLGKNRGRKAEVHIVIDSHPDVVNPVMDPEYWTVHLTTPFAGHRFAVFLPTK